ncbi:MAG: class II aldolase/adducin family protein [Halobacteriales archaeon]
MLEDERWSVANRAPDIDDLTPGRSGNLSLRSGDRFAVTPSGIPYADMTPDHIAVVDLDGVQEWGQHAPSSETAMHATIYRRIDAGAVVHAHTPWSTSLAALREPVPPVHYGLARAGGQVPVAEYATFGSDALAENAAAAMERAHTSACLLANHGLIATGTDLDAAFDTLEAVEFTARVALQAANLGEPVQLSAGELDQAAAAFEAYRRPDSWE